MHAVQAAGLELAEESRPEHPGLAVADVEAEDFPSAVGADPGGDHYRLGGDPAATAAAVPAGSGHAEGGVQEHVTGRPRVPCRRA